MKRLNFLSLFVILLLASCEGFPGLIITPSGGGNNNDSIWNKNANNYEKVMNKQKLPQSLVSAAATSYADANTTMSEAIDRSGAVSGVGGLLSGIVNTYTDYKTTEFDSHAQPNVPVGMTAGNVMVGARKLNFRCYDVDINAVDAQIIDEYFQMFGYKVNRVKVPEMNHRPYFWYTKTIDVNIDGAMPNNDLQKIKDCYNNGITFWKPSARMGYYNIDNSVPNANSGSNATPEGGNDYITPDLKD